MRRTKQHTLRHKVKESSASRAVFIAGGEELPRISLTFTDDTGEQNEYMMTAAQAARVIEETLAAYNTILPPLKTSRGGIGL